MDPEEVDLQELPSSDEEEDVEASDLRGRIAKLAKKGTSVESPEFTSPIGSPLDDDSVLKAKGRFLELKRLVQEDKKARRAKRKVKEREKDADLEGFEEIPDPSEEWEMEREGSISPASYHDDVDQLLETFRSERMAERDLSLVSVGHRLEHHPKMMEVCQQLRERDQSILSLEAKVLELDRQVIDLQDTVTEKEKLLLSKNDAVNCMINQYQQSIAGRDAELSKTQDTLLQLEKNFGAEKDGWKAEKEKLNGEIKQQNQRIKDLEDTNKLLQENRLEQTSVNIQVEEKLVVLKEDRDRIVQENVKLESTLAEIRKEKGQLEQQLNEKTVQYEQQLQQQVNKAKEEFETKFTKIKKQFAAKLKAVKESTASEAENKNVLEYEMQSQLKQLEERLESKDKDIASLTTKLEEVSKELDETKERLKDSNEMEALRELNTALQTDLGRVNAQMLETLSVQKMEPNLTEKVTSLENTIMELQEENAGLRSVQEELNYLRAEKESSDKEFLSRLAEYEKNFENTIEDYEKRIEEYEIKVSLAAAQELVAVDTDTRVAEYEKTVATLTADLKQAKEQMAKMKKQFQAKLKAVREAQPQQTEGETELRNDALRSKCTALEQRLAELEEEKNRNSLIQEELNQVRQEKELLESEHRNIIQNYDRNIEDLKLCLEKSAEEISKLEAQQLQQQVQVPKSVVTESSAEGWGWDEPSRPSSSIDTDELIRIKHERDALENILQERTKEYETRVQDLESQLVKSAEQLAKMKRQFQMKLKALREEQLRSKTESSTSSRSSSPCPETERELQEKIITLENKVALLEEEKGNLLLQMVDYDEQQAKRAQENIATAAEDSVRLEISLAEKEEELRQLQNKNHELNRQIHEATEALNLKNEEVERLMQSCSDLERLLKQSVEDINASVVTKDQEVSSSITALEAQLAISSVTLVERQQEIQMLKNQLARFEEMQQEVSNYQEIVDQLRSKDRDDLMALQEELNAIREKASVAEGSFESMEASYCHELDKKNAKIVELEELISSLREQVDCKSSEYDSLKSTSSHQHSELSKDIKNLRTQAAAYEQEIQDLQQSMAITHVPSTQDGAGASEETIEALRTLLNQEVAQCASNTIIITELKTKVQELEHQVLAKSQDYELLRDKFESKEADFVTQIETLSAQLASYEIEIEELRNSANNADGGLQTVDLHNSSVAAELEEKERQFKALEQQLLDEIAYKNEQIQSLHEQMKHFKSDHESSLEELETLRKQLSEYSTYSESLQNEAEALRTYNKNMETNYNQVYADLCQKSSQIDQLLGADSQNQNLVSSLQGKIAENDVKLQHLQTKVGQLEQEKSSLLAQAEQHHMESEALRSKLAGLTSEYIQLRESYESKELEAQRWKQDVETLRSEHSHTSDELKLKISSLMDQLNDYESELSVSASRLKESDDQYNNTKIRLEEVERSLHQLKLQLEEKTKALEQAEHGVFEKMEEVLKIEERLKETDAQYRHAIEENFAKYSDDLNASYDQLMLSASETIQLQNALRQKDEELEDLRAQLQVASTSMGFSTIGSSQMQQQEQESDDNRQPVVEPEIVPQTAYVTTQELENAQKDIKELKVQNGKLKLRFKQLKDKHDAIVKENETLKAKQGFSLDSAFEDEFMSQMKSKDSLIEEKAKQIKELQEINQRMTDRVDLLERGTDRLTEMKEEQDRQIQSLMEGKRSLETEVSALQWKMEELQNLADTQTGLPSQGGMGSFQNQEYFDLGATNPDSQELYSLRQQNAALCQELEQLRGEIAQQQKFVDELNEKNQQLEEEMEKLQMQQFQSQAVVTETISRQAEAFQTAPAQPPVLMTGENNQQVTLDANLTSLQQQLHVEETEKSVLERKIELLQSKISEIEQSEGKCFEESLMLKNWTRQLELDNLRIQHELERIYASIQDGDTDGVKARVLQDEVLRLVDQLHDRDKRCEQLTQEITRLLEERDTLQLKLSSVLRHNVSLHEESSTIQGVGNDIPTYDKEALQAKLTELQEMNYFMEVDLRREREARRLVQEQLFFSSSSRIYPDRGGRRSPSSSSPPPRRHPTTPPTPVASVTPQTIQQLPLTPVPTPQSLQLAQAPSPSVPLIQTTDLQHPSISPLPPVTINYPPSNVPPVAFHPQQTSESLPSSVPTPTNQGFNP